MKKIKGKVKKDYRLTQAKTGSLVIPKSKVKLLEMIERKEKIKLR